MSRESHSSISGLTGQVEMVPTLCGAKTRKGEPCRAKPVPGRTRCRNHGGLSTGAKTEAGREKIRQAQIKRWANEMKLKGAGEP